MEVKIHESWKSVLGAEFESPYFAKLAAFVKDAASAKALLAQLEADEKRLFS